MTAVRGRQLVLTYLTKKYPLMAAGLTNEEKAKEFLVKEHENVLAKLAGAGEKLKELEHDNHIRWRREKQWKILAQRPWWKRLINTAPDSVE